ncbi:MAG: DUF3833 family protein [Chthoniobacterales bacterium]
MSTAKHRPCITHLSIRSTITIAVVALLICASDASALDTQFRPEKFFAGRTVSSGVFHNTVGKPEQRFTTECRGRMRGRILWLDQVFRYDDGHTQQRHWQIRRVSANQYVGRAIDVVGEARGEVAGPTFHFNYAVALNPGNALLNVRLDQTMTLRRDGHVENQATIKKLGVVLSRVTEEFRRVD